MKITDVRAYCVQLPLRDADSNSNAETVLVCVSTDAGIEGWSEVDSCAWAIRAIIEAPTTTDMLHGLRGVLLGEDPLDITRLWNKMYAATLHYGRAGGTIHAMAGVDQALWDLKGKAFGKPVYQLLGATSSRALRVYATRGYSDSVDENVRRAAELRDCGFSAIKLGWGCFGREITFDEKSVSAVRKEIGKTSDLMLDAGLVFKVDEAIRYCQIMEQYNILWMEEPLHPDDVRGYGKLSSAVDMKIAAGEQETSILGFERLMDYGLIDVVQIDVTRVGLTVAQEIARMAADRGLPCANHSFTTHVNIAASAHFLTATPNALIMEFPVEPSRLRDEIAATSVKQIDGFLTVSDAPGFGIEVNKAALELYKC